MTMSDFAFRSDLRCRDFSPLKISKFVRSNLRAFSLDKYVIFQRADYSLTRTSDAVMRLASCPDWALHSNAGTSISNRVARGEH